MNRLQMGPDPSDDLKKLDEIICRLASSEYGSQVMEEIGDRLLLAGLFEKRHSVDSTAKISSILTEKGNRIVSSFKELNAAMGPLSKFDTLMVWLYLTKCEGPFNVPNRGTQ